MAVSSLASWLLRRGEKVGDRQRARRAVGGKPPVQVLDALAGQEIHVHRVAPPDLDWSEAGVSQRLPQGRPRLLVHVHRAFVLVALVAGLAKVLPERGPQFAVSVVADRPRWNSTYRIALSRA